MMIEEGIRKTIPLRRFATLEEVANAASYLLSDYASYVTGEALVIDGGQWLSGADYWARGPADGAEIIAPLRDARGAVSVDCATAYFQG